MEIIKSQRGQNLIVRNNYNFAFSYKNQTGVEVWRCVVRSCKAKLTTNAEKSCVFTEDGHHNHHACTTIAVHAISNSVKRKATEDLSEKPLYQANRSMENASLLDR